MLNDKEIRDVPLNDLPTLLDAKGQLTLIKIVKRSDRYNRALGAYPNLEATLKAIADAALAPAPDPDTFEHQMDVAKGMALAAVLLKLRQMLGIVVESEGGPNNRRYYATTLNWEELARDVLDTMYETPPLMQQMFAVVARDVPQFCGRRGPDDELFLTTGLLRNSRYC
jgi:hypothetical protein